MKLAIDIQECTRQLRAQQRAFIEQRRQIESTAKVSFLELAAERVYDEEELDEQGQEMVEEQYSEERN